jgi:hypothetical protein
MVNKTPFEPQDPQADRRLKSRTYCDYFVISGGYHEDPSPASQRWHRTNGDNMGYKRGAYTIRTDQLRSDKFCIKKD